MREGKNFIEGPKVRFPLFSSIAEPTSNPLPRLGQAFAEKRPPNWSPPHPIKAKM
jgi:hypothetical protein